MTAREVRELAEKKEAKRKRKNSRQKGARGEREFAKLLQTYGLGAYRGQQFRGGGDSPDVVCVDLPMVHFEVKFTNQCSKEPYAWIEQAKRDAAEGKIRAVAHRRQCQEWLVLLPVEDFMALICDYKGPGPAPPLQSFAKGKRAAPPI